MATIPQGLIRSFTELANIADEHQSHSSPYIYRGNTNENYELVPKIGRIRPGDREYNYDEEIALINEFRRVSRPYLANVPNSDIEWLTLAQHHGVSTRLLDWTESIFVAAYFATKNSGISPNGEQQNAALFALQVPLDFPLNSFDVFMPPSDEKAITSNITVVPSAHITPRVLSQRGVFTLHPIPNMPLHTTFVKKWTIPTEVCFKLKTILDSQGINEATLFPDTDGVARWLEWRHKWGIIQR